MILVTVYAHGNGSLKSDFYDAFVSIERGVFNTRDRNDHARKRKIISHIFSQKSVNQFEPHIRQYVQLFMGQWDRLCNLAAKDMSGSEGEGGWKGEHGRLWLDFLPCECSCKMIIRNPLMASVLTGVNYLAFDIIVGIPTYSHRWSCD